MRFYLGTDNPAWLGRLQVPLFVSRMRLWQRKRFPRARVGWALDSGAFSELTKHGRWTVPAEQYAEEIERFADGVGRLLWAAPQDWMCEPHMIEKTGSTVEEHQERTIASVLELRGLVSSVRIVPVLQGYTREEYHRHVDAYASAGIDLVREPVVGLGSVCRRQRMVEAEPIVRSLAARGLRLHGFGVKATGLERFADALVSADSMAWCYTAWQHMRKGELPRTQGNCAHCSWFALYWRDQCLKKTSSAESRHTSTRTVHQATFDFGPTT